MIFELIELRFKMYLSTLCEASETIPWLNYPIKLRQKAVAQGVAGFKIRRFQHEDSVRIYTNGAATNVVNRRIDYKLHQVRMNN